MEDDREERGEKIPHRLCIPGVCDHVTSGGRMLAAP